MSLELLQHLISCYKQKYDYDSLSLVFCGDFNSCPEFGVYQLMTTGFVGKDSADWKSNSEEALENMEVNHSLSLSSGCGTPEYTNFTLGFNGCLDYIYYDNTNLNVKEVIPLPSHEQVTQYQAIPNVVFPSDHLPIVCSLQWKK
jgi:2',5'-phosphodiesterase